MDPARDIRNRTAATVAYFAAAMSERVKQQLVADATKLSEREDVLCRPIAPQGKV